MLSLKVDQSWRKTEKLYFTNYFFTIEARYSTKHNKKIEKNAQASMVASKAKQPCII